MTIFHATYPWAFQTPGGGEIQILKYQEYLRSIDYKYKLHDPWSPLLPKYCSALHFFSCMGGSEHLLRQVQSLNIPIILSTSLWITEETLNMYDTNLIESILSTADLYITNGISEAENISRIFDKPMSRFCVVRNGFDDGFLQLYGQRHTQSFGANKTILCLANIEERKRQYELVQAINYLEDVTLILAGNIRSKSYFDLIAPLFGDKVKYLGPYEHMSDFHLSLLKTADLFVLPSTLETPGLAALEAAACGIPVLVTSEGSTREYFNEFAQYVSPISSPRELSISIENALSTLAPVPKSHIEKYKWSSCISQLTKVYQMYN